MTEPSIGTRERSVLEGRRWQDRFVMDGNFNWVLKDGEAADLAQPEVWR